MRKILGLIGILVFGLTACTQSNDPTLDTIATKQVVIDFTNGFWNMQDLEGARALVADTMMLYSPTNAFNGTALTYDRMLMVRNQFEQMMTGLQYEPINISAENEHVYVLAKATFTHDQTVQTKLGAFSPTGKEIEYYIMYKYTVVNGKIIEAYDIHDIYNRTKQMGFVVPE